MKNGYRPNRKILLCLIIAVLLLIQSLAGAALTSPDISNASVSASISYDDSNKYIYTYTVNRGVGNEGEIIAIDLDIKNELIHKPSNPLPREYSKANKIILDIIRNAGIKILPVKLKRKEGWARIGLSVQGYTGWVAPQKSHLRPGETAGGFVLTSEYPPGIKKMRLVPGIHKYGLYADADAPDEEKKQMRDFVESLNKFVYTLSPVGVTLGSYVQWDQFRNDLDISIELGWIQDSTLASILTGQLASARKAFDAGDGTLAKTRLKTLMDLIRSTEQSQRRNEVHDLVRLNCQSLLNRTIDTPAYK